jgi:HEPN domain-containing protein
MKKQVNDWLLLANNDLRAAIIILENERPLTNIAAFHCQQTIEKYMKYPDNLPARIYNP